MAEIELAAGNVKSAMQEAGAKSSDLWMVPRANIRVLPGFNVRTENAEYAAHIAEIGESIIVNGFRKDRPLSGYVARELDENIIYITDGHTRLLAVDYAIERGAEIHAIPVVTWPNGSNMEDLTVGLVTSNNGKALSPLEKGLACKRLVGYGMEEEEIAKRTGLGRGYVSDLLMLVGGPKKIRTMVASGQVSAGNAIEAMRKHGAGAADVLGGALEGAKANGKAKVTSRTLKPKRDLVADGVAWITGQPAELHEPLGLLLAHLTKAEPEAIALRIAAQ